MSEGEQSPDVVRQCGRLPALAVACWAIWMVAGVPASAAGPVEPAAAAATLATPGDLEVGLFAAEPLLSSPSNIDVDARGRVWVCEVVNYRGRQDSRPEGDRILVLEDSDGDGRADRRTVFHQGRDVDSALGICVIGEGPGRKVIVSVSPDVFIFHDDDGDLVADRRESLFTDSGLPQHDHSLHAFTVGPDGRWIFNFGNKVPALHDRDGQMVLDRHGAAVADTGRPYRQGMVCRCGPDGNDLEVLGHNSRNAFEVAVDSFGGLWQSDNDDDGHAGTRINWVMEQGNFGYKDQRTGESWQVPRTNLEAEIPRRHWHQNDPGVVPNLLGTGAGSPAGICVYEGDLLPERFRGALVHCDAGPNLVRAYRVTPAGAGYTAAIEPIVDGSSDRWFRPADACVAPDGSLIVADWYDPGVGGHGMGDIDRGRLYRIAPKGSRWGVPAIDLVSVAGAVSALASPNGCTRASALERLRREPEQAAALVAEAFEEATDDRLRARLAWAAGMLPGRGDAWVDRLAGDRSDSLRVVSLRLCRGLHGGAAGEAGAPGQPHRDAMLSLVERLLDDPSAAVRREAAITLRGLEGERADRLWAGLAARHVAGDRWELEALGIGADGWASAAHPGRVWGGQWDGRLAAWLAATGGRWREPAGREIVWRSRGGPSAAMICELIADPSTSTAESLALVRSLDFQDPQQLAAAVATLVRRLAADENPVGAPSAAEKTAVILPELVMRLDPATAADAGMAGSIDRAASVTVGTWQFAEIVRRFGLRNRADELVRMAMTEGTAEGQAATAIGIAIDLGGEDAVRRELARGGAGTARLLSALGIRGRGRALELVRSVLENVDAKPEVQVAAVRALARSEQGATTLLELARQGRLAGALPQAAALAISSGPWADVRRAAAEVLPMPKARGGGKLPSVVDLVRREGDADRGRAVFSGVGGCSKCHVVGGEGRSVGPDLSGIGAKLSREGLYAAVLAPSEAISHNYETWTALLADGRSMTGLLVSQSDDQIVVRGADGIDVAIPAAEVEELVRQPLSLMPADLATTLSAEELVDLVGWLETLRPASGSP